MPQILYIYVFFLIGRCVVDISAQQPKKYFTSLYCSYGVALKTLVTKSLLVQLKVTCTYCNRLLIYKIFVKGQCYSMKWIALVEPVNKWVNFSCIQWAKGKANSILVY